MKDLEVQSDHDSDIVVEKTYEHSTLISCRGCGRTGEGDLCDGCYFCARGQGYL